MNDVVAAAGADEHNEDDHHDDENCDDFFGSILETHRNWLTLHQIWMLLAITTLFRFPLFCSWFFGYYTLHHVENCIFDMTVVANLQKYLDPLWFFKCLIDCCEDLFVVMVPSVCLACPGVFWMVNHIQNKKNKTNPSNNPKNNQNKETKKHRFQETTNPHNHKNRRTNANKHT